MLYLFHAFRRRPLRPSLNCGLISSSTTPSTDLRSLSQSLTAIKFSNHFLLITIQNAWGWVGGARYAGVKVILELHGSPVTDHQSLTPLECAVPKKSGGRPQFQRDACSFDAVPADSGLGRPQGRRAMQNLHLSLGDAKTTPFRAWDMRVGVAWAGVSNPRKSGANFGAERSAAESTNGETGFRPKGANTPTAGNTARFPAP
jgi:hypothetical protein